MKTESNRKLFFLGLILLNVSLILSQPSNIKTNTEYPIDDPRNPNCPCHLYQQLANQEYEHHLLQSPGKNFVKTQVLKKISLRSVSYKPVDNSEPTTKSSKRIKTRKRALARLNKILLNKGREKRQRSVGLCYHWI